MSAGVSPSNPQEQSKLSMILDGLSCVGALGGTIASLMTQQVMYATVPLSVMFAVQVMHRNKQEYQLKVADHTSHLAIEKSNQAIDALVNDLTLQKEAVHSLELDTSHHCINAFNLENLIKTTDQERQYEVAKLSDEVKSKLTDLDAVVKKLRAIVADSKGDNYASAEVHYQRGLNQEQLGNLEAAISDYTLVLEQDAAHAHALLRRGLAHIQAGQKQAALLDLNAAARHFFSDGDLQNYEIAKEKANSLHQAEYEISQMHAVKVEAGTPASLNSLFGS